MRAEGMTVMSVTGMDDGSNQRLAGPKLSNLSQETWCLEKKNSSQASEDLMHPWFPCIKSLLLHPGTYVLIGIKRYYQIYTVICVVHGYSPNHPHSFFLRGYLPIKLWKIKIQNIILNCICYLS